MRLSVIVVAISWTHSKCLHATVNNILHITQNANWCIIFHTTELDAFVHHFLK